MIARRASPALPDLAGGSLIEPNTRVPEFSLLDHHGKPFTNTNLLGRWSMLYFGYTNCPDFCPATLSMLAAMERRMRAAGAPLVPQVVFVSADALRDTPAQLASVWTSYGVAVDAKTKEIGHGDAIYAIDANRNVILVYTPETTAKELLADARKLVN